MNAADTAPLEFSRPIVADKIPTEGRVIVVEAGPQELERLGRLLELQSLGMLEARVTIFPGRGDRITLRGTFKADVVQTCVVTQEPVPAHLEGEFVRHFSPSARDVWDDDEGEDATFDGDIATIDDLPDPLIDGIVDIGQVVAEQLALELDPFPRLPGVDFEGFSTDPEEKGENDGQTSAVGPFAALAALKKKLE